MPTRSWFPFPPCPRLAYLRTMMIPVLLLLVAACGASDEMSAPDMARLAPAEDVAYESEAADEAVAEEAMDFDAAYAVNAQADGEAEGEDGAAAGTGDELLPVDPARRIIKNGDLSMRVENVEIGLGRIESIAVGAGGYLLETRTDYARYDGRRATVRLAVPVEAFEEAMQRLREMAEEVDSEQVTGEDVTQQYVDLQSQIANLEATRARVREFLDQATTVEEALNVNARLTEIEGEIAERKGRLRYLAQRSARSIITVQLREPAPEIPPEPTPTPAPLPEWSAGATAGEAFTTLRLLGRGLASLAIWLGIVVLPLALPALLLLWLVRRLWRGWRGRER